MHQSSFTNEIWIDWAAGLLPSAGNYHLALPLERNADLTFLRKAHVFPLS